MDDGERDRIDSASENVAKPDRTDHQDEDIYDTIDNENGTGPESDLYDDGGSAPPQNEPDDTHYEGVEEERIDDPLVCRPPLLEKEIQALKAKISFLEKSALQSGNLCDVM